MKNSEKIKKNSIKRPPFLINNTDIANYLHSEPKETKEVVSLNAGSKEVGSIKVFFTLDRDISVTELAVLDAVSSFYAAHIFSFSARRLIEYMNGSYGKSVSPEAVERITDILGKLRDTWICINITDEVKKRKTELGELKHSPHYVYREGSRNHYLQGTLLTFVFEKRKFRLIAPPLLYDYAEKLNRRFQSIPYVLMESRYDTDNTEETEQKDTDTPQKKSKRNSQQMFLIRYYLLRRLELLNYKQKAKNSESYRKIWYSRYNKKGGDKGLMSQLDTDADRKLLRRRIYSHVTELLDYFQSVGYIEDYELFEKDSRGFIEYIRIKGEIRKPSAK